MQYSDLQRVVWKPGCTPIAVIMLSLNEEHNMHEVCQNLQGWAQEVFLVDSYSKDNTVDIALKYGVQVVQRRFGGFGNQWNFALRELPIKAPWVMKLDPDERLTNELKNNILTMIKENSVDGIKLYRRLCFMNKPLPVRQQLTRVWKNGNCKFTDVTVNEHPIVNGILGVVGGELLHYDSPSLQHWLDKQNRYTSSEAMRMYKKSPLADKPLLFGTNFQRRMWLKKNYYLFPFCYSLIFFYHWIISGAWRVGFVGYAWARSRADVLRYQAYKYREMKIMGHEFIQHVDGVGEPDSRVRQYE